MYTRALAALNNVIKHYTGYCAPDAYLTTLGSNTFYLNLPLGRKEVSFSANDDVLKITASDPEGGVASWLVHGEDPTFRVTTLTNIAESIQTLGFEATSLLGLFQGIENTTDNRGDVLSTLLDLVNRVDAAAHSTLTDICGMTYPENICCSILGRGPAGSYEIDISHQLEKVWINVPSLIEDNVIYLSYLSGVDSFGKVNFTVDVIPTGNIGRDILTSIVEGLKTLGDTNLPHILAELLLSHLPNRDNSSLRAPIPDISLLDALAANISQLDGKGFSVINNKTIDGNILTFYHRPKHNHNLTQCFLSICQSMTRVGVHYNEPERTPQVLIINDGEFPDRLSAMACNLERATFGAFTINEPLSVRSLIKVIGEVMVPCKGSALELLLHALIGVDTAESDIPF